MAVDATHVVGSIDFIDNNADVAPTGAIRMRRKAGVLQTSVDGGAYQNINEIAESEIATGAVTADKIGTGAVTSDKLETGIAVRGSVTAAETIAAARAVTATGVKANATDDTLPPIGVSVAGAASAAACTYVKQGPAAVLSAATPGAKYWLSTTAGVLSTTKPSGSGNALWLMGIAKSATVLEVNMSYLGTVP